jgi:hypothetical protein
MRICLVGLPATGKTTYIAALWAYLRSGAPEAKYRVPVVPKDTAYLNAIATAWATGSDMPRSSPGATDTVEFTIEIEDSDPVTVVLPDLPGELFLNAVRRPSIDAAPAEAVLTSDLLLLFVNGQRATTFAPVGDQEPPTATSVPPDDEIVEFAIGNLDTDTLNAELLERLRYLLRDRPMPTIVVVVSAWDVLEEAFPSPAAWLEKQQPMTAQYLDALGTKTTIGIVGVSAQGADYGDEPLIHHKPVADRAWGRADEATKTDIAGPLLWFDSVRSTQSYG